MSGLFWGKPVYICPRTSFPPCYQSRKQNDEIWVDLKWYLHKDGKMSINYDKDIVETLIQEFNVKPLQTKDIFSGLAGVHPSRLVKEVGSHANPVIYRNLGMRTRVSTILNIESNRIGFIGSQVIGLQRDEVSDFDIVVNMPLSRMSEFAKTLWDLKKRTSHLQKDKLNLHFPYKVFLEGCTEAPFGVDLFPKALDLENHFLVGAEEWSRRSTKQEKKFEVMGTSLAHEGWPVLFVNRGELVVILCNGFRGVFVPRDLVIAKSFNVSISYADHKVDVWVIDDPFRDIEQVERYFKFRED